MEVEIHVAHPVEFLFLHRTIANYTFITFLTLRVWQSNHLQLMDALNATWDLQKHPILCSV